MLAALFAAGCKGEGDAPPSADAKAKADPKKAAEPRAKEPPARAKQLWGEIGTAYADWSKATEEPNRGSKAHGTLTLISYNDVAKGALAATGAWPEGSIFVKQNFAAPGELDFITVMSKEDGTWFWARYKPDGTMTEAGGRELKCPACHKIKGQRDYVIDTLLKKG